MGGRRSFGSGVDGGRDEPTTLAELFWSVARRSRHQWIRRLAPWDVSPSQLRALGTLMRHGPVRPSTLAEHLGIAARSATEVVDALEDRGLVRRETDPADRRATLVAVTEHGRETAGAIRGAQAAEADRLFDTLDDADRAELTRILRLLAAAPADPSLADPGEPAPSSAAGR